MRQCAGRRVDDQSNEENDQEYDECFNNEPLVVLPDDVLESFQRVHEPQKRRVRAAVHTSQN